MIVRYSSNNSGGDWWLKDADWHALEKAGWKVNWFANEPEGPYSFPKRDGRWLGALASHAEKDFPTPGEAMREFETVTGARVTDQGCGCCGPPHSFSWDGEGYTYASGEDCLPHMFGNGPATLREAYEAQAREGGAL